MKVSCEIIRDLLPLYHDGICSAESAALIEEHLAECAACAHVLEALGCEQAIAGATEVNALKALRSIWKSSKAKAFFRGALLVLLACAVLIGGFYGLTQWKILPVPAELLEVSEVSRLSDGRIVYHLGVRDNKELHFVKFTLREDGSYYMTPMRSVIEWKRSADAGLFNQYFLVDIAEDNAYNQANGGKTPITACYLGPVGSGILLWEEGMELPPASEALEDMCA